MKPLISEEDRLREEFRNRTHTRTTLVVRLDIYSNKQDVVDLAILSNIRSTGVQVAELLRAESVKIARGANEIGEQYSDCEPSSIISSTNFETGQNALSEREFKIAFGSVSLETSKPDSLVPVISGVVN